MLDSSEKFKIFTITDVLNKDNIEKVSQEKEQLFPKTKKDT